MVLISTMTAFLMTAFSLAELGDGFGMFFDMYLLGLGWTETSVILSGILRGVVDLSLKSVAGDIIDKTSYDRRNFLAFASLSIAASSLMVFLVNGSDFDDKMIVYVVRSMESVALAFIPPIFNAITLSAFGPEMFDQMQIKKELCSHAGAILSSILSSIIAWVYYPNIEFVFLLPTAFALSAVFYVRFIPKGDPLMGRGFHMHTKLRDEQGCVVVNNETEGKDSPVAATYRDVFLDKRILAIIIADVFHVIAEANVGLIFNETLADVGSYSSKNQNGNYYQRFLQYYAEGEDSYYTTYTDDAVMSREAIPLLATAGTTAREFYLFVFQMYADIHFLKFKYHIVTYFVLDIYCIELVMIGGTFVVGYYTARGWGRKPFYLLHLSMHSIRVLLLILCLYMNAGKGWLVSTELIGGLTGAFGIVNAFMRADILFGSGRMNVVDGYQATIRGIAATSSQYIGGVILENKGPMTSLIISFIISLISPIIGAMYVPETLGMREKDFKQEKEEERLLEKTKSLDHYDENSQAINYVHMELT